MEGETSRIHKWLLGGRWRHEADSKSKAQELYVNEGDYELEGEGLQQELDSRAVIIVPGPPVELDAREMRTKGGT